MTLWQAGAGRRSTSAAARVRRVALVLASGLAASGGGAPTATAQPVPDVDVVLFTPRDVDLAGRPFVFVYGLLRNRGPLPARDVHVELTALREPGGEVFGRGSGTAWLAVLDAGEEGPFSVAVGGCCAADVGEFVFDVRAEPAGGPRYGGLAVEGVVERTVNGERRVYGDLANTGAELVNARATGVFMGFWDGDDLVELETARLPIVYAAQSPSGQSHPPGFAYPWSVRLPDVDFDRYTIWAYGEPYPPGVYPVPLGARNVRVARVDGDIRVDATLFACGAVPAETAGVVVVARDAEARVVEFGLAVPGLEAPIPPGGSAAVRLTWPAARPEIDPSRVRLYPFALETQSAPPPGVPCPGPAAEAFLPTVSRHALRE